MKFKQKGVGLIEVMVALLVLAIGALGYAGLQVKALKNTDDANSRAHAILIAQDALERFQSNPAQKGYYHTAGNWSSQYLEPGGEPAGWKDCVTNACSAVEMAKWDIKQLSWVAANVLPAGMISAQECSFSSMECVVVSWGGSKPSDCTSNTGIDTDSACVVMEVSR